MGKLPSGCGQVKGLGVVGASVLVVVVASVLVVVVDGAAVDRHEAVLGDVQTNVSGSKTEVPGHCPM